MNALVRSSVTMLLREAAEEIRARPDSLTKDEIVALSLLAHGFGHAEFLDVLGAAFWRLLKTELEASR